MLSHLLLFQLVGSSLFIMLPKSVKKRVLDYFESNLGKVGGTLSISKNITEHIDLYVISALRSIHP
jgi:hypothetical protein